MRSQEQVLTAPRKAPALLVALRPKQWLKNLLVFAAPLAAGSIFQPDVLLPSIGAFVVFCLASSATYLINDVRDVEADRRHPKKQYRPIAADRLSVRVAVIASAVLVIIALGLAWWISVALLGVTAAYLVFTLAYSLTLKHEPVIELALLALGFLLRAVAGAAAADLPVSQWFLIVAAFGSLFMATGKRFSELERHQRDGDEPARRSLAGYSPGFLRFVLATSAAVTITAYCLWAFEVAQAPSTLPWAQWSVLPFVLAVLRYGAAIDRGEAEAPEDAALHDRVLLVLAGAWLVLFGLGALSV
jgi:decaprenyl-phosphate phosphoribosyltransferase